MLHATLHRREGESSSPTPTVGDGRAVPIRHDRVPIYGFGLVK
jgi:hypothetical protein